MADRSFDAPFARPIDPSFNRRVEEAVRETNAQFIEENRPTFAETYGAQMGLNSRLGSNYRSEEFKIEMNPDRIRQHRSLGWGDPLARDEGFLGELPDRVSALGMDHSQFVDVENDTQFHQRLAQIRQEEQLNETIENSTLLNNLAAGTIAAVLDPANAIPGGQVVRAGKTGAGLVKSALSVGGAAAGLETLNEVSLQGDQATRSLGESAVNIGGAAVFGGLVGAGSSALMQRFAADLEELRHEKKIEGTSARRASPALAEQTIEIEGERGKVNSPEARRDLPVDERPDLSKQVPAKVAGIDLNQVDKLPSVGTKGGRLLISQSATARAFIQKSFGSSSRTIGQTEGVALVPGGTVNDRANIELDGIMVRMNREFKDLYVQMITGRDRKLGDIMRSRFGRKGQPSMAEFGEMITQAGRHGDNHEIPQVQAMAQWLRKEVYDPYGQRAVDVGLLDGFDSLKTAASFAPRQWDGDAIVAHWNDFVPRMTAWLTERQEVDLAELGALSKKGHERNAADAARLETLQTRYNIERGTERGRSAEQLEKVAAEISNRLIGTSIGRMAYEETLVADAIEDVIGRSGKSGALKSRVLDIPDNLVSDFLVNDPIQLAASYVRTVSRDIHTKQMFGSLDMAETAKAIELDYIELKKKAKTPKAQRALERQMNDDLADLEVLWSDMRGQNIMAQGWKSRLWRAGNVAKNYNFITLMGGAAVSQLADAGKLFSRGFRKAFKDELIPVFTNLKDYKAVRRDLEDYGIQAEIALNTRAQLVADLPQDGFVGSSALERGMQQASNKFSLVNGMTVMNDFAKSTISMGTINRVNRILNETEIDEASPGIKTDDLHDTQLLARMQIDGRLAKAIKAQLDQHGIKREARFSKGFVSDFVLPELGKWTDIEARDAFSVGVRREVDHIILTQNASEKTRAQSRNPLVDVLMQFMSHALAATRRVMIDTVQGGPKQMLNVFTPMVIMGMVVYVLKQKLRQLAGLKDDEIDYSPDNLVTQGVDRSGFTGYLQNHHNTFEKITGLGLSKLAAHLPIIGDGESETASSYASRSAVEGLLGPTYGGAVKLAELTNKYLDGEITSEELNELKRFVPGQNLFPIQFGLYELMGE